MRVSRPLQMMPPGAQIVQVQSYPHAQPVQLVQGIADEDRSEEILSRHRLHTLHFPYFLLVRSFIRCLLDTLLQRIILDRRSN